MSKNDIKTRIKSFSKRLVDTARDEYYATPEARIDTIFGGGAEYYKRLRSAKREWDDTDTEARKDFQQYLRDNYGIQMKFGGDGVDLTYEIVDQQKHTIFLLKFGG